MKRRFAVAIMVFILPWLVASCGGNEAEEPGPAPAAEGAAGETTLSLTSPAFAQDETVPTKYTCDGEDVSPPLAWEGAPAGTEAFTLIMDDPDAPGRTWVHWVVYNLPPDTMALPESVPAGDTIPGGGLHGSNSWDRTDYGGPCPPSGEHRYFFKLYALDTRLDLEPGADKATVLEAMDGHVLGQAQLTAPYER